MNNEELYDLKTDPGETENMIVEHSEVVDQLRSKYDQWWAKVLPRLVNEDAYRCVNALAWQIGVNLERR